LAVPRGLDLSAGILASLGGEAARRSLLLLWAVWALLVVATARPQWLGDPLELSMSGRDIVLAVDVSASMEKEDMEAPDGVAERLALTKQLGAEFIDRRIGDRVGLILFGSNAYLQAPLTFDRATVKRLLEESFVGLAGRETALGDAIGLAIRKLDSEDGAPRAQQRVLVLVTDGVNNAGILDPQDAAALAAEHGVRIYTVGVGSDRAPRGTVYEDAPDLDEASLNQIAQATGGQYFRARDAAEFSAIYAKLDEQEPTSTVESGFRPVTELFQWPLALAALLGLALLPEPWRSPFASRGGRLSRDS
jgi:Ca-activated chloride channel family protein